MHRPPDRSAPASIPEWWRSKAAAEEERPRWSASWVYTHSSQGRATDPIRTHGASECALQDSIAETAVSRTVVRSSRLVPAPSPAFRIDRPPDPHPGPPCPAPPALHAVARTSPPPPRLSLA